MASPSHDRLFILVIDDNFDAAEMLFFLLAALGYVAYFRISGASGITAAEDIIPDLILLDLGMPLMDGYEVAQRLRDKTELQKCRIVALSAWDDSDTLAMVAAYSFNSHITKPAEISRLLRELDSLR